MGPRLGRLAVTVVLLLAGCNHPVRVASDQPAKSVAPATIPEPTPTPAPYADADAGVRQVVDTFVRGVLEYDANSEAASDFVARVASVTTARELARLRMSPRANLDWRVLRDREERVTVAVTGISTSPDGGVLVAAERTTHTTFATVHDFVQLTLRVATEGGDLKVADAEGAGL